MTPSARRVVFVPGGVTPAAPSYAPLLEALGDTVDPVLKDLEVYAGDAPPPGYSLALEAEGLLRTADDAALDRFHLVAYSGGAAVALAFAARHPDRLRSLAMFEPAAVPGRWDAAEAADWQPFLSLDDVPADRKLAEFTLRHLRPGVEPPPPPSGPAPAWMAKRPAGLDAMMAAFARDDTDRSAFGQCAFPVYLAHGALTGDFMLRRVQLLAGLLPDVWIEAYPGLHHFVPPQRTRPGHYAESLRLLWDRAERRQDGEGRPDEGFAA